MNIIAENFNPCGQSSKLEEFCSKARCFYITTTFNRCEKGKGSHGIHLILWPDSIPTNSKRFKRRWLRYTHMAEGWASGHDGGFIDGHGIFSVVGNDGMARLMVGCDDLVLLVDLYTPPLRAYIKN